MDRDKVPQSVSPERFRIAIVGTPRSGNTWLRHLLALTFDLEERGFPFEADVVWDPLPDRCALQVHALPTESFLADLARHGFRPVVPARHPLDVLVSLLSFATQRFDPGLPGGGLSQCEMPIVGVSPRDRAFLDYAVRDAEHRHLGISAAWWDRPGVVGVRYEDLVADTAGELRRLVREIGAPNRRPIEEVVAEGKMERMRTRETFVGWPHHFFQGRPGLWRSVLPAIEARRIAGAHGPILEALGYRCDADESLDGRDADLAWYRLQADASRRFGADERANVRRLRADLDHELAGHEQTRGAYRNAVEHARSVCHLLYDERVSSDLIRRDAEHWRARAEAAQRRIVQLQATVQVDPDVPGLPEFLVRLAIRARSSIEAGIRKLRRVGELTRVLDGFIVAGNPPTTLETASSTPGRSPHGPSRHPVHRPVGRPAPGGHLPEGRPVGLRRY